MSADLVEVLWDQTYEVRDDVQCVHLELLELWWSPSRDNRVGFDGVRIQIEQESSQEAFLHHDVVSLNVVLSMTDREYLCPEELLQLQVFVSNVEDGLVLIAVDLIEDGVGDHLLEDALVSILVQEELVTLGAGNNVVDEDADLVTKAFVILLVATSENHLEGGLQRWDHFGVNG